MGPYPPRVALVVCTSPNQSVIGQRRWGFHTLRAGVDPGEDSSFLRDAGVIDIRRGLSPGHEVLSSQGGAGSTHSGQSTIGQWYSGLHTVRVGVNPRDPRFRPGVSEL